MKIKQFICGLRGHHFSTWIPSINAKWEHKYCVRCYKYVERKVV